MHRVLIVDDEIDICRGLGILINWEGLGFDAADFACDGAEALYKLRTGIYDVLVTDIRMPEIDGIELIKKIYEAKYPIKTVVLSGYKDFEYARAAVEMGVKNYLLKPISRDELIRTMEAIKKELEDELVQSKKIKESENVIMERILQDLLKQGIDKHHSQTCPRELGIDLEGKEAAVCVIGMDDYDRVLEGQNETETDLKKYSVKNIASELVKENKCGIVFDLDEDMLGIIFCIEKCAYNKINEVVTGIYQFVDRSAGGNVVIAIGSFADTLSGICQSYRNACKALNRKRFTEGSGIIFFHDAYKNVDEKRTYSWKFDKLISDVELSREESLVNRIDAFCDHVLGKAWPINVVYSAIVNLITDLINCVNDQGGDFFVIINDREPYESIFSKRNIFELRKFMLEKCLRISKFFKSRNFKGIDNEIINKMIEYIIENYNEHDLSLKKFSTIHYMNATYLGRLFKKHTNMYFTDYVNETRIRHSVKMLDEGILKVYEICEKVGYNNLNYFYKIFKGIKGISPTKYREDIQKAE